jgi:hypothetical protein
MKALHDGPMRGHFDSETTSYKILRVGYYWPTIFKESHAYSHKCKVCQKCDVEETKFVVPLQPMVVEEPFEQWGLDINGKINLHSSRQN